MRSRSVSSCRTERAAGGELAATIRHHRLVRAPRAGGSRPAAVRRRPEIVDDPTVDRGQGASPRWVDVDIAVQVKVGTTSTSRTTAIAPGPAVLGSFWSDALSANA